MNSLRQNVSGATLFQLGAELSWLFAAITLLLRAEGAQSVDGHNAPLIALLFAGAAWHITEGSYLAFASAGIAFLSIFILFGLDRRPTLDGRTGSASSLP